MGTRQSTAAPPAAGGTQGRGTTSAADSVHLPPGHHHHHHHPHHQASTSSQRAIGVGGAVASAAPYRGFPLSIPASNGGSSASGSGVGVGSPDSDDSTPDDDPLSRAILGSSSLPVHLFSFRGRCLIFPSKTIISDLLQSCDCFGVYIALCLK